MLIVLKILIFKLYGNNVNIQYFSKNNYTYFMQMIYLYFNIYIKPYPMAYVVSTYISTAVLSQ